jgi:hypothetical protein
MNRWYRSMKPLLLSAILSLLAVPGVSAAEPDRLTIRDAFMNRPPTNQVLLSLRLARVRKDEGKVSLYKSVARQRRAKEHSLSGERSKHRRNCRVTSGWFPPSGR